MVLLRPGDRRGLNQRQLHVAGTGRKIDHQVVEIAPVDAAQALVGQQLNRGSIEQAADLAAQAANPRTDHRGSAEYKRHMVRTFVIRILSRSDGAAAGGAGSTAAHGGADGTGERAA